MLSSRLVEISALATLTRNFAFWRAYNGRPLKLSFPKIDSLKHEIDLKIVMVYSKTMAGVLVIESTKATLVPRASYSWTFRDRVLSH